MVVVVGKREKQRQVIEKEILRVSKLKVKVKVNFLLIS